MDNSWKATANVTNAKEAINDFYRRHPRAVKGMEASILALVIKLEHNRAVEEDQIKKMLAKHPIRKKLLATGLAIPQIMEAINNRMTQLKKQPLVPQSKVPPLGIKDQGTWPKKPNVASSRSEHQQKRSDSSNWWTQAYQELQKQTNQKLAWPGKQL